ncbi:MAG: cyclic pyranopterin monophosphate synthase MoaC [Planctomycetota bacterium]|nr:MAG: cyclic pyranopterin monophosphate synthase MoaC [Planctomycetota bacterium]REJ88022.1 MAG: cyclic pyranopterin monophosphate synthase MoaC [Planctomycetota bacterium]REK29955.1 MAG: cyclic pyranopterin monophosphate synthase MoaC [Planctomycetota bacterium]REK47875.1 MAG: cyclic pyranopterin monophosphate synthase MoaC [Planctomycetota bacterium]
MVNLNGTRASAALGELSHFDEAGAARMVDVGQKEPTPRYARASARVRMHPHTLQRIREGSAEKGDVLQVARLAGIQGAKSTAQLIPLCHPLGLDAVTVDFRFDGEDAIDISAAASVTARTGVEMEALTAASTAALTIYDMCKSMDREIVIEQIQLDEKRGGKSGHFRRA